MKKKVLLSLVVTLLLLKHFSFGQTPDLGASSTFALFTAAGAFNGDAATSVVGDIGTDVGAYTPPGFLVGQVHLSDPVSAQAAADVATAYGYLAGLTCGSVLTTPLGNSQTLAPNIYCIGTAAVLNADLILDGGGDPGAIFVFQINGALSTNSFSNIVLINGANLCNVYWQINGAFNAGGSTSFQGTILAEGAINLGNGASLSGRGLSTAGAISTSANVVSLPNACLCTLDVTCPNPSGGTFQCVSNIPAGVPTDVTVNSSCGTTSVVISETSTGAGCTASPFILTRIYTVTDDGGHSTDCTVTYTVIDNTLPTLLCPSSVSVSCLNLVPIDASPTIATTDNCGGVVSVTLASDVISGQTCVNRFNILRTYQANDPCGNTATCTQSIAVNDQTLPTLLCPINVSVSCLNLVPVDASLAIATTDNCGGAVNVVLASDVISAQTCPNRFNLLRTYLATDLCGNSATCAQTISVNDQTLPTLTCPLNVTVSCVGDVPTAAPASIPSSDNCGGAVNVAVVGDVISAQTCVNRFTITRTYGSTDLCGNVATCAQTISVNDQTLPTLTCPLNVTVSCVGDVPTAAPASIPSSDNCGGTVIVAVVGDVISAQTCVNRFTITRTYGSTDVCGNFATCAQTISVNDQTLPTLTCPLNVTVSCAANVPAAAPASIPSSDNCGGAVNVAVVGDVISAQSCANRFTLTRTYGSTDLCGNFATCAQTILVNDQTLPTITCPANVTVACFGEMPIETPLTVLTADNCGGVVNVVLESEIMTGQVCPNLFMTRTYLATDLCGNFATCAQILSIQDNIPPTFDSPPANITVDCFTIPGAGTPPTASDNCLGTVTVALLSETQLPGICPVIFTLTRIWVATDDCGNSATVSQTLSVLDTYAPQFTNNPLDVLMECDIATNLDDYQDWLDNFGGATASDCSVITWSFMDSPGMVMPSICGGIFQHYIRFIATDECGNTAFRDARFIVQDLTPPTFTVLPQNLQISCVEGDNGEAPFIDWFEHFGFAQVSDNCGLVTTEIALLFEKRDCGNTFTRTYQFRATDECGNTNFITATFAVVDTTPPVIIKCPESNVLLTCEYDIPAPDTAGLIAWDNCGGPLLVSVQSEFATGVGCGYWPLTKSFTYAVTDACGNVSTCYQSFQVVDSIPPVYTGQDTIVLVCAADLPGPGEIAGFLAPLFIDACYASICVYEGIVLNDSNSVTYCVRAKDLCVNWTDKFLVTFIATGDCKPLCTAPQTIWGNPAATINGIGVTTAIEQLIATHGAVTAGKLGKTISVSSATCLQSMLPGNGNTVQFAPGNVEFGQDNECLLGSPLLNSDGTLKNKLASNVLAMQLNIWYNQEFNERELGVQLLATLPPCLVDPAILSKLEMDHSNVQGLLNLSNDYLAGVGFFSPNFGNLLSNALDNLNNYWLNCLPNNPCSNNASVAGKLNTASDEGLEMGHVQLNTSGNTGQLSTKFTNTDAAGNYEFPNAVPMLGNYSVIPNSEDMAQLNGVTTYDLVLISKHILGWEPFNSPYKMIAADANRSGSITSFDIIELRKLILGIYDELPDNTSWRFVDQSFLFPDPNNPFATPFPESKTLESIHVNQMSNDFVSVKIGDVNGTAQANNQMPVDNRTGGTLLFDLEDRSVQSGEIFETRLKSDQTVQSYQFTLNTNGLELLDAGGEAVTADNFAVFAAEDFQNGQSAALTTSWNQPEFPVAETPEIILSFRATQSGKLSEMLHLSSRITKVEAIKLTDVSNNHATGPMALDIALRFQDEGSATIKGIGFELYQNVPNPFADKTSIGFYLPEATQATLTVYDETGRVVYTQQGDFAKGYNAFSMERQLIKTNGSLLYKLETATDRATKIMIQAK